MKIIQRLCWLFLIIALIVLQHMPNTEKHVETVQSEQSAPVHHQTTVVDTYQRKLLETAETLKAHQAEREARQKAFQEKRAQELEESIIAEEIAETDDAEENFPAYYGGNGTVKSINGRTAVVSIFASDPSSSWNWNSKEDVRIYSDAYYSLLEADEWLEKEAARWGADTEIISDWMTYNDLYYEAYFDELMLGEESSTYYPMSDYIDTYIHTSWIMENHNADSIAYIFYFNGAYSEDVFAYAYPCYSEVGDSRYHNEIILVNCGNPSYIMKAGTFAHELLHTFGLPDMYYADDRIPEEYVSHLDNTDSDEIMFRHANWDYYGIQPYFTELDVYYLGLTDYAYDLDQWSIGSARYCN